MGQLIDMADWKRQRDEYMWINGEEKKKRETTNTWEVDNRSFAEKKKSSSEFDERIARIRSSLGKINSVMAAIRSEVQKKERESSNKAILRKLGKAD